MSNDAIDYINRDIVNVKKEVEILSKLVRDGNGRPSLILQVETLSNKVEQIETSLQNGIDELKTSIQDYHIENAEKGKMTLSFKTAIVVAVIGSFTSLMLNYQSTQRPPTVPVDTYVAAQNMLNKKLDVLLAHQAEQAAAEAAPHYPTK